MGGRRPRVTSRSGCFGPWRPNARSAEGVATFTVHADARQSARWKQAVEGEGFPSVGSWLAGAADAYLKARARAGMPIPLAWRKGRFKVELQDSELVEVRGHLSPPFGSFCGTADGPSSYTGRHRHALVYVPSAYPGNAPKLPAVQGPRG